MRKKTKIIKTLKKINDDLIKRRNETISRAKQPIPNFILHCHPSIAFMEYKKFLIDPLVNKTYVNIKTETKNDVYDNELLDTLNTILNKKGDDLINE